MSELRKCEVCRGTKKIMGIGHMESKCDACLGVGWIDRESVIDKLTKQTETPQVEPTETTESIDKPVKKPRKKPVKKAKKK